MRWLCQKPAELDLQPRLFQKEEKDKFGYSRTRVNCNICKSMFII